MRRIAYARYGGPEELYMAKVEPRALHDNEIQIGMKAAAANPMDWKIRAGAVRMMTGRRFPRGVGTDFAGVVEAVGRDVKRFKVGDAVFGAMTMKDSATFSDFIITAEDTAASMPASISFEVAATLPVVGATAWTALIETARLQQGQRVFINGCLGGVGRAAVQIARLHGAEVVGSCRAEDAGEAQALGVEKVVDYRTVNLAQFRKIFDVVFDTAGSLKPRQCLMMLKPQGVALHINLTPLKMVRVLITRRNKAVIGKAPPDVLEKLGAMAANGSLGLPISSIVPLSKAIPALLKLEEGGQPKGKLVVVPD